MSATAYFAALGDTGLNGFVLGVMVVMAVLALILFRERGRHEANIHSPPMAWLRAWLYYGFVLVFSWSTGVLNTVLHSPLATAEQMGSRNWQIYTLVCCAVAVWGYAYWWPRGTLTHGRKFYLLPTLLHGSMWGVCSGLMTLSIYSVVERLGFPGWINGLLVLGFVAVYNLNYQLGWWDIHVSPPHNIRATNNLKVALAHNPFLLATLSYFIVYGNAGIFVLLYAFAMACSALAMHFPPFWAPDGPPVSRETALGV